MLAALLYLAMMADCDPSAAVAVAVALSSMPARPVIDRVLLPRVRPLPPGPADYAAAQAAHKADDRPFAVLLTATWCVPCQALHRDHGAALRQRWPHYAEVDVDATPALARSVQRHARTGMVPTLVIYERAGGKPTGVKVYTGLPAIVSLLTGGN